VTRASEKEEEGQAEEDREGSKQAAPEWDSLVTGNQYYVKLFLTILRIRFLSGKTIK